MYSRQRQMYSSFYDPEKRLTTEEWTLIMDALRAYQHNEVYRALYEKLGGSPLKGEAGPSNRDFDTATSQPPV